MESKEKEKKTQDHKFSMRMTKEEIAEFTKFGRGQGFRTLAKLVRKSLEVVQRNPSLLQPTEDKSWVGIMERLQNAQEKASEQQQTYAGFGTRLEKVERIIEQIALNTGMTKTQLKKLQKKDTSSEAVFEE